MMQDTILTLSKDSVKQFVEFMMKYIPEETLIQSTSEVKNRFPKLTSSQHPETIITDHDIQEVDEEIPDSELTEVQRVRRELNKMFSKDKDPEPLFVLDLILKPNQLIP